MSGGDRALGGPDLAAMREVYSLAGLAESDLAPDWLGQLRAWLAEAVAARVPEPNAMVVATATSDGMPAARTVLCKGMSEDGVVFYTNLGSDKSRDLEANPRAAATFPWIALQRQVHVRGTVERMPDEAARAYWATRPRGSQIGAWASPQSRVIEGRAALDELQRGIEGRFGPADDDAGDPIPLPPFWGGWRIRPSTVEFWQGRVARLHDRLRYRNTESGWVIERLAP
jgi:pyridoxamine 5'-phosphate oxidase